MLLDFLLEPSLGTQFFSFFRNTQFFSFFRNTQFFSFFRKVSDKRRDISKQPIKHLWWFRSVPIHEVRGLNTSKTEWRFDFLDQNRKENTAPSSFVGFFLPQLSIEDLDQRTMTQRALISSFSIV